MMKIKIGEAQPLPCKYCGTKHGYKYFDLFRMGYWSFHKEDGIYHGGEYNDGTLINKGITAYCDNCGKRLPFKLERRAFEEVKM